MAVTEIVRRELPAAAIADPLRAHQSAPLHDDPLLSRLLLNRGIQDATELDFSLSGLPSPALLLDMDKAVAVLSQAIAEQQRILVVGDYDCDGATSTALAVLALRAMGANRVDYLLPNRFEHGYGLSSAVVKLAANDKPDLIVTVDNGIASVEGVECARDLGIDVLVTDHHLPPPVLPRAAALINPNIPGARFPSGNIAGVGVIFFVMAALRQSLRESGWFEQQKIDMPNLAAFLDLVAIGTVADVVILDAVNRTLVEQGVRRIRVGRTRPGVLALLELAGKKPGELVAQDIGYVLGPRLNAAGRLSDMRIGVECLLAEDPASAMSLAKQLHTLNAQRRSLELEMRADTDELVNQLLSDLEQDGLTAKLSLCLYESHWHEGVIGILAGRLKDKLNMPVIIFARSAEGRLKGSARSIAGLHIYDVLKAVQTDNPELYDKFGGHAMAAGLDIAEAQFAEFELALEKEVMRRLNGRLPSRQLMSDGELELPRLTMETAHTLKHLAPWGQGFPEPLFDNEFEIVAQRVLKERHLKLTVKPTLGLSSSPVPAGPAGVAPSGAAIDAIWFGCITADSPLLSQVGDRVRLAYRLDVNHFRNAQSLQLKVEYLQVVG